METVEETVSKIKGKYSGNRVEIAAALHTGQSNEDFCAMPCASCVWCMRAFASGQVEGVSLRGLAFRERHVCFCLQRSMRAVAGSQVEGVSLRGLAFRERHVCFIFSEVCVLLRQVQSRGQLTRACV